MSDVPLFKSFFIGGLECSSHRLGSGRRLDMLAATRHDEFIAKDYRRLQQQGIHTVRSGLRWHLIEPTPGHYDFSSVLPALRTAQQSGMQIIWDLCHYGWPDDIDIFKPNFVQRFARFAAAFAHLLDSEADSVPFICPINEISFFSWGGGDAAYLNPFQRGRGYELKVQLVRAAIESIEAVWDVLPQARIVHVDPVLNIIPFPDRPHDFPWAEGHRQSQYQAWDMLSGRSWPLLGGDPKYLDIIGMNYYANNQWIHGGPTLDWHDPLYRPFRQIVHEVYERYERPMFIAETGIENEARPDWMAYMGQEARAIIEADLPLEGLCLYPILNHPGWDDDRHCHNGLWDYADAGGEREVYAPFQAELQRQTQLVNQLRSPPTVKPSTERRTALKSGARQPHICLFTDSFEPSGMGEQMLALASELCKQYEVTFICPDAPHTSHLLQRASALPITVLPLEVHGQARQPWEQLRDYIRTHHVDIFHSHAGIGWEGHDGIFAAYFGRAPIIVRTEHLPYLITDWDQRARHRDLLQHIARLICVSNGAYTSFINAGIEPDCLRIVRNGIVPPTGTMNNSTSNAQRARTRSALNLPHGAKIALTVGRLTEQKGHRVLLDAIPAVLAEAPNMHFVWVGDGPLAEALRWEIEARDLTSQVHLLGHRADIADLLAAADLFVLPSLFEGLPLVVLEAMAVGVPVIATNIPGTDEVIEDGVSGRLVAPADATALAEALLETVRQPTVVQRWTTAARARFTQQFTASRMAQEVSAIYQELLQQADLLPAMHAVAPPARAPHNALQPMLPVLQRPR